MNSEASAQHARDVVTHYAAMLHVSVPSVRIVNTSAAGPCYEALANRIEIDTRTLDLPEPLLRLVLAHEVGHATQRRRLLLDLLSTCLFTTALLSLPCYLFATSSTADIWRISAPGLGFIIAWLMLRRALRPRATKRAAALELDADAKAAQLCGAACALDALETMAQRMHIEPARLEAMRVRFATNASAPRA
jgi:Zn-dependent protease with chaperone function